MMEIMMIDPILDNSSLSIQSKIHEILNQYFRLVPPEQASHLYDLIMNATERSLIESVLNKVNGNQTRASEILGIHRTTLRSKLKHFQKKTTDFKIHV